MAGRDSKCSDISIELERLLKDFNIGTPPARQEVMLEERIKQSGWIHNIADIPADSENTIDMLVEYGEDESDADSFARRLEEIINEISDQYGGILTENFVLSGVKQFTVLLEPGKIGELMMRIAFLREVDRIDEGQYYGPNVETGDGMIGISPYSTATRPANQLRVVLRESNLMGY